MLIYTLNISFRCENSGKNERHFTVRAGSSYNDRSGQIFNVKRVIQHEEFNNDSFLNNDFSLLELMDPIRLDVTKQLIRLPDADEKFPDGLLCSVSGWGDTGNRGKQINQLRRIEVLIII